MFNLPNPKQKLIIVSKQHADVVFVNGMSNISVVSNNVCELLCCLFTEVCHEAVEARRSHSAGREWDIYKPLAPLGSITPLIPRPSPAFSIRKSILGSEDVLMDFLQMRTGSIIGLASLSVHLVLELRVREKHPF